MQEPLKVLSLLEPWATLVAIGAKGIETRSWATKYRGEIFIHASKAYTKKQRELARTDPFWTALQRNLEAMDPAQNCGHIIARTKILDVVEITKAFEKNRFADNEDEWHFGDYTWGRFAWILAEPKRLVTPVPIKGNLSLWNWQPEEYPELIA